MTTPRTYPMPVADAKRLLLQVWWESHPNQPMGEGRAVVDRCIAAIEAEAAAAPQPDLAPETEATPNGERDWPSIARWWQSEAWRFASEAETLLGQVKMLEAAAPAALAAHTGGQE